MEKTVEVPNGVEVEFDNFNFKVSGKLGKIERNFFSHLFSNEITIERNDNLIKITSKTEKRKIKAMVGTIAAHINNMMNGVTKGWTTKLKIVFVHFPVTVKTEGDIISITNFLGGKAIRKSKIMDGVKVEIKGEDITVSGIDKDAVGETSARMERATKVKARDRRIFQDGIFITEKGVLNESA